jgi:hypothetical protein
MTTTSSNLWSAFQGLWHVQLTRILYSSDAPNGNSHGGAAQNLRVERDAVGPSRDMYL